MNRVPPSCYGSLRVVLVLRVGGSLSSDSGPGALRDDSFPLQWFRGQACQLSSFRSHTFLASPQIVPVGRVGCCPPCHPMGRGGCCPLSFVFRGATLAYILLCMDMSTRTQGSSLVIYREEMVLSCYWSSGKGRVLSKSISSGIGVGAVHVVLICSFSTRTAFCFADTVVLGW